MESYTTISVKPKTKKKIRKLKGDQSYTEYINTLIEKKWQESEKQLATEQNKENKEESEEETAED